MTTLWLALSYAGLGLEAALVFVLFRRGRTEFPLFFSYIFCRVVASVTTSLYFFLFRGARFYGLIYWILEFFLNVLVIAVIVSLMRKAAGKSPPWGGLAAAAVVVLGIAIAVVLAFDVRIGFWMTGTVRNLSFFEELLNLALWMMLVQQGHAPPKVLWVSAGLGIQVTGDVLGHTLRLFASKSAIWAPNALMNVCEITALLIWLYAFCRSRRNTTVFKPSSSQAAGSPCTHGPSVGFFPD